MTVEELFLEVIELPDSEARTNFLHLACRDNTALRQEAEALLAAHFRSGPFLDVPAAQQMQRIECEVLLGSSLAGKYQLLEILGEGGMGTVFLAQQLAPVSRTVAVKVVKAGMDSKAVLARFEAERHTLAMMDHPNIAKVLDAGTTPMGKPYFVMELVHGVPITKFCDDRTLTPRQRLELFIPVCQAIQHAHQKGIIHRDIKPSNVLVAQYDERPIPKVIDFGVAKAVVDPSLAESATMTGLGTIIGTPEYMSPEQAGLNHLDIDTRTDVYSLGVLLYELLTGTTPVDRQSLRRSNILDILQSVRDVETPKPSTKLSTLDNVQIVSAMRRMDPANLRKMLQGELDWVILKAIEKDRTRRYETVNSLCRDIQRYLADELVEARPPSWRYRLTKSLRRHRGPVIAAILVLVALLAGIIGTGWGLARSQQNERKAIAASELTAARLKQIETINNTVFDIFAEFDVRKVKEGGKPVEAVLAQKLIVAGQKLDAVAIQDPLVLANLNNRLGATLVSLGQPEAAIDFLRTAVEIRKNSIGREHEDTLISMNNLAVAYREGGMLDQAVPLAEDVLAIRQRRLGSEHPDTWTSMNNLAVSYKAAGKLDRAVPLYEQVLGLRDTHLGRDHPDTLNTMSNLAVVYREAGKVDQAVTMLEQTHTMMKARYGHDHPDTLTVLGNLALADQAAGKRDKALPLFEQTVKLKAAKLGMDHPDTLTSMSNLAGAYESAGQLKRAIAIYQDTRARMLAKHGIDHPDTLTVMNNLALAYKSDNDLAKAVPLLEQTLQLRTAKLGPEHPSTLTSMNNLATAYESAGKLDQAVPLFQETLALKLAKLGIDHPSTHTSLNNLGKAYESVGLYPQAIPLYERLLSLRKASLGHDHAAIEAIRNRLIRVYELDRRFAEAEVLHRETVAILQQKSGQDSAAVGNALRVLAENLLAQKKWVDAEQLLRKCLAISETKQPDSFSTANTRSLLGGAMLGQKQYAEAEPLLLKAFEGLETYATRGSKNRLLQAKAVDRLIELYEAMNKSEAVAKWQAERVNYRERAPKPRAAK